MRFRLHTAALALLLVSALWAQPSNMPGLPHEREGAAVVATSAPDSAPMSVEQFAAGLLAVRERVAALEARPQDGPALIASLPKNWVIRSGAGEMKTSADWVREGVDAFLKAEPKAKPAILASLKTQLSALHDEAVCYPRAAGFPADSRQKIASILAAREFRSLRGASPLETFWQRVLNWLREKLDKLSPNIGEADLSGPIFAWVMIAIACAIAGVWIFRRARQAELEVPREIVPFAPGDKSWRLWLNEAESEAGNQRWREAMHLAFWAGVSRLESEGMWRPDRARTPREYLRAVPGGNAAREPFASAVRRFERAWYGGRAASGEDYAAILADLEKMGCR